MLNEKSRIVQLTMATSDKITLDEDENLPKMPKSPSLKDFFNLRFSNTQHVLQSANLAQISGCNKRVILACLLHDIAICGYIRGDHGYYGAQLVAPYVDEEIQYAIKAHQILRFFPDSNFGYVYPKVYIDWFGEDYEPDEYIKYEYKQILKSPYYEMSRLICCFDLYSFDENVNIKLEQFYDIIDEYFKQPIEGLGFDNSSCAHMWRTIIRPNKFL